MTAYTQDLAATLSSTGGWQIRVGKSRHSFLNSTGSEALTHNRSFAGSLGSSTTSSHVVSPQFRATLGASGEIAFAQDPRSVLHLTGHLYRKVGSHPEPVPNPPSGRSTSVGGGLAPMGDLTIAKYSPMLFRLLATVADSGVDFLGNTYRSAAITTPASNVISPDADVFWLSQPNPSQFAVESLYRDQRINGQPAVVDRFTLDPLTPNVNFHVYWSNDPAGPGVDNPSWENLLWTPVHKAFQASRKTTYALPEPIVAKYLKVEFTGLQPRSYDPGEFQLPTTFRKHPKWVLDYFLARFAVTPRDLLSSSANITYDALDLAFSYYASDLIQDPDPPVASDLTAAQTQFFQNESDGIDPQTLSQIKVAFQPFLAQPALLGRFNSVIGNYAARIISQSYSTETIQRAVGDTSIVSSLMREPLLVEKDFPVMHFFIPCRHGYRISQSVYEHNVAYFAGVKSLIFHRDNYVTPVDTLQYNEPFGDGFNLAFNDLA